jgi:membrane-associated phospholipid phosphatase
MTVPAGLDAPSNYFARLSALVLTSGKQLVRAPSHSRRAEAARRSARHALLLTAIFGAAVLALMYALDAAGISLMPPRGTASLWPLRILTDFGKDTYVLCSLAGLLFALAIVAPRLRGTARSLWLNFGTRLQFLFLAVLTPVLAGEVLKFCIGRGRPFVGGKADAFNFVPFSGGGAYASLPSGHAITAAALAFAVVALWPRTRVVMAVYAALILMTRLVLLAHHPSDVVAGALLGVVGVMLVRYWFAARRLAFIIRQDGAIAPLPGPSPGQLKRVARDAFAP